MLPYIDAATFQQAPTGIDPDTLVFGGDTQTQNAELENILERASRWVDNVCRQRLAATTDQEQIRVRPNRYGQLELYPKNFPIIALLEAAWLDLNLGAAAEFNTITISESQLLDRAILIYDRSYMQWRRWGAQGLLVQFQYENGYAHTTLATDASPDASAVTVESAVGIGSTTLGAGAWNLSSELVILDGASREPVTVTAVNGTTLTLAAPLVNAHTAGALVTAIPQDVQQTTIDFAAYLIKTRGFGGMEMTDRGFTGEQASADSAGRLGLDEAFDRLLPYTRVGAA